MYRSWQGGARVTLLVGLMLCNGRACVTLLAGRSPLLPAMEQAVSRHGAGGEQAWSRRGTGREQAGSRQGTDWELAGLAWARADFNECSTLLSLRPLNLTNVSHFGAFGP